MLHLDHKIDEVFKHARKMNRDRWELLLNPAADELRGHELIKIGFTQHVSYKVFYLTLRDIFETEVEGRSYDLAKFTCICCENRGQRVMVGNVLYIPLEEFLQCSGQYCDLQLRIGQRFAVRPTAIFPHLGENKKYGLYLARFSRFPVLVAGRYFEEDKDCRDRTTGLWNAGLNNKSWKELQG